MISFFLTGNCQKESVQEGAFFYKKGKDFFSLNYDSSEYYFKKATLLLKKENNIDHYIESLNYLGALFYYKGDINGFFNYSVLASEEAKVYLEDTSSIYIGALANLGVYHNLKGASWKAIECYNNAFKLLEKKTRSYSNKASVLNMLGFEYESIDDYENSLRFFHEELKLRLDSVGKLNDELGDNYFNLGRTYLKNRNREAGVYYLKKSLKTFLGLPHGQYVHDRLVSVYHELAKFYLEDLQLDATFYYLEKAKDIFTDYEKVRFQYRNESLFGLYYVAKQDFTNAKTSLNNAIEYAISRNKPHRISSSFSNQYTNLANLEYDLQNYEEALDNYQKAITHLFFDLEINGEYSNPSSLQVARPLDGIQGLHNKAKTLHHLYLQNKNLKDLELALSTYQLAARLIQKARQDITTTGSKQLLAGEVLTVYEGAIKTALKMHEVTGDKKYLEEAFRFAESNKAILLLESINEQVAKNYGGVPDTLQEQERAFRIDIAFYERLINEEKQKREKGDTTKIENWEKILFNLRKEYGDMVDLLEKEYPRYFEFKYNTELANVLDVQQKVLDSKSALLEYFVGEDQVFLFCITPSDLQVYTIPKDEVYLKDLPALLNAINTAANKAEGLLTFAKLSYSVYQTYLEPTLKNIPPSVERLIIVPDDRLTFLPYEVLLQEPYAGESGSFNLSRLTYLLKKFHLDYTYSSTLLVNTFKEKKKNAPKPLLAMAPSFDRSVIANNRNCNPDRLYSLQCSPEEVEVISRKLGGSYIVGSEAVREKFLKEAGDYQILHLATHSCSDQENPMLSRIYFSNGDLSNYDLYNLELNAELAVLSSCNTGSGKLVRGEGVMSLSKGFIHAGCPSTLISLWSVDDCATSDIMIRYYENLEKGMAKDIALKQAKLNYIESADKLRKHPYYWAAFIQMGDFNPLHQKRWSGSHVLLGTLVVLGVGMFWRKTRVKQVA